MIDDDEKDGMYTEETFRVSSDVELLERHECACVARSNRMEQVKQPNGEPRYAHTHL